MSNIEKGRKEIIDRYTPDIVSGMSCVLENIYNAGWHSGRKEEREKWSSCGYLMIDPCKIADIKDKVKVSPCKNCKCYTRERLTGCLANPQTCDEYQEYSFLCELLKYFNK